MTSKDWLGHWHGYGPWVGTRDELGQEYLRVPAHPDFLASPMPPVITGHWLLRQSQTSADRTWTTAGDAVEWLKKVYHDRPPTGDYMPVEDKARFAEGELLIGNDVVWAWYYGRNFVSSSVICCPNLPLHPDIPCPPPLEV